MSRRITLPTLCLLLASVPALAATPQKPTARPPLPVPKERSVSTQHSVTIGAQTIRYTATAGTILLRDKDNNPIGSMFYVAYTEDGVRNLADRPVTFLYNGGPGASSDWIQMGGLGPYRVNMTNGGATPPAPYSITPSHESLLNDSDLVFIDAMGTGYSHIVGKGQDKMFWGVDEDVKSFGQFIYRYLKQNNRWQSPKFLYGESYGTTRSAALADYLQDQGIALNGVILQSSVLNYFEWAPGSDNGYVFDLPSFAAIAWYHNALPNKPASLADVVQQAREFADGPYAQALRQGDLLPKAQLDSIAQQLHGFTGLPVRYLERANLRVSAPDFRKELLLPEREHMGRFDARFIASDADAVSSRNSFDPSNQFTGTPFTAAFEWYLHNVLKYHTDRIYKEESDAAFKKWDWKHDHLPLPYVAGDLAAAMRKNPYLRVLSENGYFDLATPFHKTEYDLDHAMLSKKLRSHIEFAYFKSGHMIYLNPAALKAMHAVLDNFYSDTLKSDAAASQH
ncbi:MAG: S10 family peptidase [Steroidobacteraceae bacterium]